MIAQFCRWLSLYLQRREICAEGGLLYLERFKIFGWMPGSKKSYPFSVYLHRFHLPDQDTAPHSHPWKWCFSIVLSGQYLEMRPEIDGFRWRWLKAGSLNVIRSDDFHRITSLHGEVWTLFVVGPKSSSWGFLVDGQLVPWRDRLQQRGIKPSY